MPIVSITLARQGQVTTSFAEAGDEASAFVYRKDTLEELGVAESVNRAFGINDDGAIVGQSTFGGAAFGPSPYSHAALFANGSSYDLGSLQAGEFSRAHGINASGQVVGFRP